MAITLPNRKICRNLQEQVAANMANLEAIAKILDGLNVHDNVVVIDDITQNLTADEIDITLKEVAFLVYQGQVYIKKTEDVSNVYFDVVFSITGSTVLTFNSKEITVLIATGALTLTSSSVSTYSESQLDSSLALKSDLTYVDAQIALCAKLTGANFTGPITASSITENMSGYAISNIASIVDLTYGSVVKNGNKITFVAFLKATPDAQTNYNLVQFSIPQSIGEKLYPFTSGSLTNLLDVKVIPCFTDSTNYVDAIVRIRKVSDTSLVFELRAQTLTVNTEYFMRIEVTFLLSDNLAS